jgi:2-methylcitrate dehydratase
MALFVSTMLSPERFIRHIVRYRPTPDRRLLTLRTTTTELRRILAKEQLGYEGGLTNPMSWDRTVEKFHWLSAPFADEDLRGRLIEAVQQVDTRRTSDLIDLLAQVRRTVAFPATHPGIQ